MEDKLVIEPATPLDEVERLHLIQTLKHFGGNVTKTASALKVSVKTIYNKMNQFGLRKPRGEG